MCIRDRSISGIIKSITEIKNQPDPIGRVLENWEQPNGLKFSKISVPLGVLGVIYESRPNVTVDASCLALKSNNALILRGGSDSYHTSKQLVHIITESFIDANLPENIIQMIPTTDREAVDHLLAMKDYVNVIIPRGGKNLVKKVQQLSSVPTIWHLEGICHSYLDKDANPSIAKKIIHNAKLRNTAICGATETILLHEKIIKKFGNKILKNLEKNGCKIIGDNKIRKLYDKKIQKASIKDWSKEYLSPVVSVKSVKNIDEAIAHINKYGTMHTDCIITQNKKAAKKFLNEVKSSIAMHNTSTQFADGGEFGFGGEVGISTNTLPPRGPVGLNQLISYKYQVTSKGQVRK